MKYPLIKKFVNLVEKFLGWDYVAVILSYKETVEKFKVLEVSSYQ